jgi:hypothetical protein
LNNHSQLESISGILRGREYKIGNLAKVVVVFTLLSQLLPPSEFNSSKPIQCLIPSPFSKYALYTLVPGIVPVGDTASEGVAQ